MNTAMDQLCASYGDDELQLLADFLALVGLSDHLGQGRAGQVPSSTALRLDHSSSTGFTLGAYAGRRSTTSGLGPASSYAGQPQDQHSDEGSGG